MGVVMGDDRGMDQALIAAVDELTGGQVDALSLIAKFSPTQDQVHINQPLAERKKQKRQAQVGLASNVVGIAAGTAALGQAGARAAEVRAAQKAGRKAEPGQFIRSARWARDNVPGAAKVAGNAKVRRVARAATSPRAIAIGAGGALALQAANTGGDLVANRVLAREANKKHPVEKRRRTVTHATPQDQAEYFKRVRAAGGKVIASPAGEGRYLIAFPKGVTSLDKKLTIPGGVKAATGKIKDGVRQQTGVKERVKRVATKTGRARATADSYLANTAPGIAASAKGKVRRLGSAAKIGTAGAAGYAVGQYDPKDQLLRRRNTPALVQQPLPIAKKDGKHQQAFGWVSVTNHPTEGIGPDKVVLDRQGDIIHIDDLEQAAYKYVRESRVAGNMHQRDGDRPVRAGELIESMIVTPEKLEAIGVPSDVAKQVPVGWWAGYQVEDPQTWHDIDVTKKLKGFSVHGTGVRTPVEKLEEVLGKALVPRDAHRVLPPDSESRKIKRLKQSQAAMSGTAAVLGLSALGLRGASGAAARRATKGYAKTRSDWIRRAANLDRQSNRALVGSAGVGGAGGLNFAALQRKEAKRETG